MFKPDKIIWEPDEDKSSKFQTIYGDFMTPYNANIHDELIEKSSLV